MVDGTHLNKSSASSRFIHGFLEKRKCASENFKMCFDDHVSMPVRYQLTIQYQSTMSSEEKITLHVLFIRVNYLHIKVRADAFRKPGLDSRFILLIHLPILRQNFK